jgi:prephenate dehydrogenase
MKILQIRKMRKENKIKNSKKDKMEHKKNSVKEIKNVCIIGLGQLGGSIAANLIKKNYYIIGISKKESTIKKAKEKGIINEGYTKLKKEILAKSDLVIIATHLGLYEKILRFLHKIKYSGIVSDVGSVKKNFYDACKKYNLKFVGAHPIAGTEKSGIESSDPKLFENKVCIISGWSDEQSKKIVSEIWRKIGSKIVVIPPEEHDKLLAFTSHLPHVIAFSAVKTLEKLRTEKNEKKTKTYIAGGSLKDITRVAQSPTEMWVDIFTQNSKNISDAVKTFQKQVSHLLKLILSKDRKKIKKYIESSKKISSKIIKR